MISDQQLEAVLAPLLAHWNSLSAGQVRALCSAPLPGDTTATVSYVDEERTPYGYAYVQLEISNPEKFTLRLRIEGSPGDLSMATHLPVAEIWGDQVACARWINQRCSGAAQSG